MMLKWKPVAINCLFSIFCVCPLSISAATINSHEVAALQPPSWASQGVVYSLFIRNFTPEGTLNAATKRLTELKRLGITVVWLLPVHPIGQAMRKGSLGSPYSIQDYYQINSDYGTKDDLIKFIEKAHELGLRVIIDAVLNHTSWDNTLMSRPDYYKHDVSQHIISPMPEWKDVAALDYQNPNVRAYVIDLLLYWIREFNVDGFRFDAASFVPLDFWTEARQKLLTEKADLLLLGEQEMPEALAVAFNMDYDWKLEEAIHNIITNGSPATETLKTVLAYEKDNFPQYAQHLRFTDNHDKRRALTRFGEKGALAAAALIFTLDGVPLLYNGMEVGDSTESTDPALFEKMSIFWKSDEIRPHFQRFFKEIIALRRAHPALQQGEVVWIPNSDGERVVTYQRRLDGSESDEEAFLIAINLSNRPFSGQVTLEDAHHFHDVTPCACPNTNDKADTSSPLPTLALKPWEFRIYSRKK